MSSTRTTTKPSRSFKPVPFLDIPIDSALQMDRDIPVPPSPIHVVPDGKMLRTKKDMKVKRFSAPPSPISSPLSLSEMPSCPWDASVPSLTSGTPPLTPDSGSSSLAPGLHEILSTNPPQNHTRTQSQPTPVVKLGHPSRPYYTAIRPRPVSESIVGLCPSSFKSQTNVVVTSDSSSGISSARTSLSISPPEIKRFVGSSAHQHSSFLDVRIENGDAVLPTPSALSPPACVLNSGPGSAHLPFDALFWGSAPGLGHSASGETEMKIAAAAGGRVSYTFTDATTSSSRNAFKQKVKKWGKNCKRHFGSCRQPPSESSSSSSFPNNTIS